eukprot:c24040_g1_i1.p1 GENE.c24040_g1_i1~~c24040_g1_i1.p1  ORF type:complete len:245 (-),score=58.27 c24040_g1_i1:70-759(-)
MFALKSLQRHARPIFTSSAQQITRAGSTAFLPDLSYDYGELEPFISADIMKIHHTKHHQTYITNLNAALEQYKDAEATGNLQKMIGLQGTIRFNGGGHVNHSIFWTNLAPVKNGGGARPTGELATMINEGWGNMDNFISAFNKDTVAVQGSGWGWLVYNTITKKLEITTRPNQDPVSTVPFHVPLLGIDVWEHAYYLQYKNVRPDYLKAVWNVVNWANVSERLAAARTA